QFRVFGHDNLHLSKETPKCAYVLAGTYTLVERSANELNWIHTTASQVDFDVDTDYTENVTFGNVCIGAGGGLTLGYWSNKNGQSLERAIDFNFLSGLCLVNAAGTHQTWPTGTPALLTSARTNFSNWLLNANATNMAYMLSAQL